MRQRQSVGIDYSARCNATCEHCCVGSSPRATAILEDEQVDEIVTDLTQHTDVYEIGITGGEPFLRPKRLFALLKSVKKRVYLPLSPQTDFGASPCSLLRIPLASWRL